MGNTRHQAAGVKAVTTFSRNAVLGGLNTLHTDRAINLSGHFLRANKANKS